MERRKRTDVHNDQVSFSCGVCDVSVSERERVCVCGDGIVKLMEEVENIV